MPLPPLERHDQKRSGMKLMLRRSLVALAYRFAKVIDGAPERFPAFEPGFKVRSPHEVVRHINGVLNYALNIVRSGDPDKRERLVTLAWEQEVARAHAILAALDDELSTGEPDSEMLQRLLQGPISDAMTHVGQLAMLRRLAGSPISGENFFRADLALGRLGPDQPPPRDPDQK